MSGAPVGHYLRVYRSSSTYPIHDIISALPYTSYRDRKKLMTVFRSRSYPEYGTVLYNLCMPSLSNLFRYSHTMKNQVKFALESPMLSGFVLSALLSAPYELPTVKIIKNELLWKEVSVMESIPRSPSVSWDSIYDHFSPLHSDWKPCRRISKIVQRCIYRWTLKCENTILYPSMSSKTVSKHTRDNFEDSICKVLDSNCEISTTSLEHHYSRSGKLVYGSCELRQKWYPTQASPRTYFAQGGSAYNSSKFLRDAFNWLGDTFLPTNRFQRVNPTGMHVDTSVDDVYIYDLTSFTSLFHEQRPFLEFLARLCGSVKVTVFDSWEGPLVVSLGSLINDYILSNVCQPTWTTKIEGFDGLELVHSVAGFLGVFGNLATCTFPHGIALSTIRDSEHDCWCAGDDAGTKDDIETGGRDVNMVAQTIGSIAFEKTFIASQPGAVALKRPIGIFGSILYQRRNILWPIFSVMCDDDPRYNLDPCERVVERVLGAIVAFLQTCVSADLSSSDIEFAYEFFSAFYERYNLPMSGWYPPLTGFFPYKLTVPRIERSAFGLDPLQVLIGSFFGTEYVAILENEIPWTGESTLYMGNTFQCNSDRHLSYLEKLGYLIREAVQVVLPGMVGYEQAIRDTDRKERHPLRVYQYTVIEKIPSQLMPLSCI